MLPVAVPDAHLRRLDGYKRHDSAVAAPLGEAMIQFFQGQLARRQTKLSAVSEVWCQLVPEHFLKRCALESFHRGRLTVIVDSAPHLFQLKQVLLAGLESQLLAACRGAGLRKVMLKRGRWYDDRGQPQF